MYQKKISKGNNPEPSIENHWFTTFGFGVEIWLIYWHMFPLVDTGEKETETETHMPASSETLLEDQLYTSIFFGNVPIAQMSMNR